MQNTNNNYEEIKNYFIKCIDEIKELDKIIDAELKRIDEEKQYPCCRIDKTSIRML